jgi:glycerate kinase
VLPNEALREEVEVTGPLGTPVAAVLGWLDGDSAIFESATACGIALLKPHERDPLRTTTRGVGELIWEAVDRGATTVVVGLGGSATVDGGGGAARGLGWTLRDQAGAPLPEGGGALANLASLEGGWGVNARIVALTDVTTPLVGPEGAAPVFGPQKGATPAAVERLAAGLEVLAAAFAQHGRAELANLPGGGAAGGLGAGLAFFAGGELVPGAGWVLERVGFDAALATADLLITGEGAFDRTSLVGKASGEVLRRAQAIKKKVAVVAGSAGDLVGVPVASGEGDTLDAAGIAALAERVTREVLGLPSP